MKITDLTHDICEGMPVYPGTEPPEIKQATAIAREGFEERLLTMFSHTGTHMDAPSHVLPGTKTLSDYDASDFSGKAVRIDVQGLTDITPEHLLPYTEMLEKADFAVLWSGWDSLWGQDSYFSGYPVLTGQSAELLTTLGLKGICMDMISIDRVDELSNHRIVFKEGLFVVENLTNLDRIGEDVFTLFCLPIKIKGGDGAPVRAVALSG